MLQFCKSILQFHSILMFSEVAALFMPGHMLTIPVLLRDLLFSVFAECAALEQSHKDSVPKSWRLCLCHVSAGLHGGKSGGSTKVSVELW